MKVREIAPVCISAVLPGCGHIAAGQHAKGLLLFFLFGFAVDGVLYGRAQSFLRPEAPGSAVYTIALLLGMGLWVYAVGDTVAIALRSRRIEAKAEVADSHIRQALVAYLADDLASATDFLRAALRVNPRDPDALFHLGVVHARAGRHRQARRALRRCLRADHDGKWDAEADAELRALEAAPAHAARPASPGADAQGSPAPEGPTGAAPGGPS